MVFLFLLSSFYHRRFCFVQIFSFQLVRYRVCACIGAFFLFLLFVCRFFFSSTLDRSVLKALFTFTYYVLNTMHAMCCVYHKTSIGCNHGWAVQCVYGSNKFDLMHLRSLELNKRSSNFGVRKRIFFLSLFNFALDLSRWCFSVSVSTIDQIDWSVSSTQFVSFNNIGCAYVCAALKHTERDRDCEQAAQHWYRYQRFENEMVASS